MRILAGAAGPVGWRHTLTHPAMSTHRHVRVEVEGIGLNGRRETFATSIIASDADRARGAHIQEARFRAKVWGLRGPLRIVGEQVGMPVAAPAERWLRGRPWRRSAPAPAPMAPIIRVQPVRPSARTRVA